MMMTVRWKDTAVDELTAIWTAADSAARRIITAAVDRIDRDLKVDPIGNSESRGGGVRIYFAPPMGATFHIESDGQTVSVLHVWQFGRPR